MDQNFFEKGINGEVRGSTVVVTAAGTTNLTAGTTLAVINSDAGAMEIRLPSAAEGDCITLVASDTSNTIDVRNPGGGLPNGQSAMNALNATLIYCAIGDGETWYSIPTTASV